MVKVTKIQVGNGVTIAYEQEDGVYIIKSPERGIEDFYKSIVALKDIFATRAMLQGHDEVIVNSVEKGDDPQGIWYRLAGTFSAHGVTYKVNGDKMRSVPEEVPEKEREKFKKANFGTYLSDEEIATIENALLHGAGYVEGERQTDGVQELPFTDAKEVE